MCIAQALGIKSPIARAALGGLSSGGSVASAATGLLPKAMGLGHKKSAKLPATALTTAPAG